MSEQIPDSSPAVVPPIAPGAPVTSSSSSKSISALAVTGLILGIVAVVFSLIPLVNIFTATWLGPLAIVFSVIAVLVILVGKHRRGLVMAVIALVLAVIATAVVFSYTANVNHALNNLSTLQSAGSKGADSSSSEPAAAPKSGTGSDSSKPAQSQGGTTAANPAASKFLQDYKAFADKYATWAKSYKANPTDAALLSQLSDMEKQEAQMAQDAKTYSGEFSGADLQAYTAATDEIAQAVQTLSQK